MNEHTGEASSVHNQCPKNGNLSILSHSGLPQENSPSEIGSHSRTQTFDRYRCLCCNKRFTTTKSFDIHNKIEHNSDILFCVRS